MKGIKTTGLILFLTALSIFTSLLFIGKFQLTEDTFNSFIKNKGIKSEVFIQDISKNVLGKEYDSQFDLSTD
ncbi:MAG: FeS-binding protein, partial [Flavobacteriales bacterium CG_4_10_14_0_8_um_filter_32_5]